jgi:tRNA pseudouridine32 synthase/23S rRNA pseudouridine746 synthase
MEETNEGMAALSEGLVYVDEHLLVLDKPAGLLAVPGRGADKQDCLSLRAQQLWPDALVVHRLDMATSGLVLMARGIAMQRRLSRAFEPQGVIDVPILPDWPNRPLQKVDATGRPSTTRWRRLAVTNDSTRLALEPVTGRTHQLRVHLQAIGHPIVGDMLYAPPVVQACAPRLLLHATRLQLTHPATGEPLLLESPAPF